MDDLGAEMPSPLTTQPQGQPSEPARAEREGLQPEGLSSSPASGSGGSPAHVEGAGGYQHSDGAQGSLSPTQQHTVAENSRVDYERGPMYKRGRGKSFFREQPRRGAVCQVPGCDRSLHKLRDYYKRYKICPYHLELPSLVVEGQTIRFCQQCGRFQLLADFEGDRRSCRTKLNKHNERRRKAEAESKAAKAAAALSGYTDDDLLAGACGGGGGGRRSRISPAAAAAAAARERPHGPQPPQPAA